MKKKTQVQIKAQVKNVGLNQRDLAKAMKCSQSSVSKLLSNNRPLLATELFILEKVLNVEMDLILFWWSTDGGRNV